MTLAFFGANGASGILILIGLAILAILSVVLFVGGVATTYARRYKLAAIAFILALALGFYPLKLLVGFVQWNQIQKTRNRDFDVAVSLYPNGDYLVTVNGVENHNEVILLDGNIEFHVVLSHSRTIKGRSSSFQSRRENGAFGSFDFGKIEVPYSDRTAFMATMTPAPKRALYSAKTDTYTIWFRRTSPEFEWFSCARTTTQP